MNDFAFVKWGYKTNFFFCFSEGCPVLTTCSSREIEDSSGATRTSRASSQVVNVIHFSEIV